jgi:peptide/nickel transport system substrate-binding protein
MKHKLVLVVFSVLVVIVLIGSSCTGPTGTTTSSNTVSVTTSTAITPQSGGTLKISINTEPISLDPPKLIGVFEMQYLCPVIETLFRTDKTGAIVPWLATDYKLDLNALTLTLFLKKNVKFHDGTDFNAAAVKWNLERYMATKKTDVANIKSVEVVDDYTVKLNLVQQDSRLLWILSIYPGMMVSPTAWQNAGSDDKSRGEWAAKHPVGTGPYKFVSWEKNVSIKMEQFTDYWQTGKPYLDGIEYVIITDPVVALASFMKGGEDILFSITDVNTIQQLKTSGQYTMAKTATPATATILFGDSINPDSPYSNLKVRQAIECAIDKKAIAESLGLGYWEAMYQFAVPSSWAYNADIKGYPYDVDRAKQLLTEAGYPNGFSTKIIGNNTPPVSDLMPIIQSYLAKVGITAEIEMNNNTKMIQIYSTKGSFSNALVVGAYAMFPNEFVANMRNYPKGAHEVRYPNVAIPEEYEQLCAKGIAAESLDEMKAISQQMEKMYIDQYAISNWLYGTPAYTFKSEKVNGDAIFEIQQQFWTPEDAWLAK